jgi:hypothetical protein
MNPLNWKREHQMALVCAGALGGVLSFIAAVLTLHPGRHFEWCVFREHGTCAYFPTGYVALLIFWTFRGTLVSGAIVYIRQLLRT